MAFLFHNRLQQVTEIFSLYSPLLPPSDNLRLSYDPNDQRMVSFEDGYNEEKSQGDEEDLRMHLQGGNQRLEYLLFFTQLIVS